MKRISLFTVMLVSASLAWAQTRQIKGRIVDKATGQGVPDVSVMIKGTNTGARTDANGDFVLPVNSSGKVTLEASAVGFTAQSITTDGGSPVVLNLEKQDKSMDEVVVIGYGTVKRRDLTGSVASVKTEEITKVPAQNPLESIQGKIAGADITRSNGSATSGVSIRIRGNRSIGAGNEPLYIVDGVQTGSIADINPNDIESIEFLKDASSTAIYGYQGANGIVIVTTKKGSAGKPKISFNSYYGISSVSRYPKSMDMDAFVALKREAFRAAGKWSSPADDAKVFSPGELAAIQRGQWTDYQDLLIRKGRQQDYQLGVSAGSDKTKLYFSLDAFREDGLLRKDWSNRYSARFNLDQTLGKWIKMGLQSQVTYREQSIRRDPLNQANKINPLGLPYDSTGKLITYPLSGSAVNPLADEQPNAYSNRAHGINAVVNAFAELKPFSGFTFRSNLGTNLIFTRTGLFESSATIDRNGSAALATYDDFGTRLLNWDNIATYQKQVQDHSFTFTALSSFIKKVTDDLFAKGEAQLIPSQLFYSLANATQNKDVSSLYTKGTTVSFAGRMNYSYKGKYLVTLTDRIDGASQLSPGHKWTAFPSAALAWRLSDENFMNAVKPISDLKIRASYGVAGNAAVGAYSTLNSLTRIPFAYGDSAALGFTISPQIGNPDLGWELSATKDFGLDFGLFNGRLSGTFDYYDTRTRDLLLPRGLPPTTGVTSVFQNIGKTRNHGIEVSLSGTIINKPSLNWSSTLTYTRNKEEIVSLVTGGVNDIGNGWFIGQPTAVFYDYRKIGIWQTADSAQAASFGQKPGDVRVEDISGPSGKPDGKIDATYDRTVIAGNNRPKWYGGWNNTVKYKGFDLTAYIFVRWGQTINPDFLRRFNTTGAENSSAIINYWTPEYPSNDYPRPNANLSLASMLYTSTIGYVDGSYVRLRNLSLGYTFPHFSRSFISSLRIYATGNNLATYTRSKRLKNYDPERGGSENFPMTKTFVFGVNVGF